MERRRKVDVNWVLIRAIVGLAFVGCGLLVLGLSIYGFLRVGEWGTPSIVDAVIAFDAGKGSITAFFQEWIGLRKILDFIPLWLALMAVGYFIGIAE